MRLSKNVVVFAILLMFFPSCKENSTYKAAIHSTTKNNTAEVDEKQAYINKYNMYVAIWNNVSPRVERSYSALYNTINDKTGMPLKTQENYFIPTIPDADVIKKLEENYKNQPIIDELDNIAPIIISSYKALQQPLQELSDYYKLGTYKDDDLQTASQRYLKVRKPIKDFMKVNAQLGAAVQEIDSRLALEALDAYKANNQLLLYNKGMIINSIKKHSNLLYQIDYDAYDRLDLEAYESNLKDVVTYYTEFKKLATDKNRLKTEMHISRPSPFIIYYRDIDNYIKESRSLKALIENPKDYNKMKSLVEKMGLQFAASSHKKVTDAAERVINSSNNLN
ncbi:DUF3829 domain-containing protein [uncultured Croceitalea sp.]|uniref:DUF3829 domain-containing protein n=1 Tax=uncultured Croceitalea sp. TaxID=1798908 RepID=UPI003305C033